MEFNLDTLPALANYGYVGLFVLLGVDALGLPLGTELALFGAGYLASAGALNPFWAITAAVVGSLSGGSLAWSVGRRAGLGFLLRFRRLGVKPQHVARTEDWFRRWGDKAVLFAYFAPVTRNLIAYPAGMAGVPYRRYVMFAAIGATIFSATSIFFGNAVGDNWRRLLLVLDEILISAGASAVLAVAWSVWRRRRRGNR